MELVSGVIGDDVILWGCHVFCKPAAEGYETPWHQDGHYWPIRPLANCTVWVALEESTVENGCLRVIPRSHAGQQLHDHLHEDRTDLTLNQRLAAGSFDEARRSTSSSSPAQMSLHDVYMIHGAAANRSRSAAPAWRCATCRRPRCSSATCGRWTARPASPSISRSGRCGSSGRIAAGATTSRSATGAAAASAPPRLLLRRTPLATTSLRALVQAAAGIAALCALDATVKELTRSYTVAYAVLGRYVFGTAFALAVWWCQGRPVLTRAMLPAHLTRGILIAVTAFLFFYSLTQLGMAEAITLSFISPLLIPPLAHLLLGERMRGPVVLATLLGFAGVLFTVQGAPSFGGGRGLGWPPSSPRRSPMRSRRSSCAPVLPAMARPC